MSTIKTLIVACDFSPYSKVVVRQAIELRKSLKAELVLFHSHFGFAMGLGAVIDNEMTEEFKENLQKKLVKYYGVKNCKVQIEIGEPSERINLAASRYSNPLLMVGYKGMGQWARFFLGSTAERIALTASFPVWIHRGEKVRKIKQVLVPHDLSKKSTKTLDSVSHLIHVSKAKVDILNVIHPVGPLLDFESWSELQKLEAQKIHHKLTEIRKTHKANKIISAKGDPSKIIVQKSKSYDLVAMATHAKERMFPYFGSVTAKVARATDCPVLII